MQLEINPWALHPQLPLPRVRTIANFALDLNQSLISKLRWAGALSIPLLNSIGRVQF